MSICGEINRMDWHGIADPGLREIGERVAAGGVASDADALAMLRTNDLNGLGAVAFGCRLRRHGRRAYYGGSVNLNYTNICELRCPLCAFSRDRGEADAYVLGMEEVARRVGAAWAGGADEVHVVGGLNPQLGLDYYLNLIATVKQVDPQLYIVAFTATEYEYLSRRSGVPVAALLARFRAAGVDALPGGGAEIFAEAVRRRIAPKKISGDVWLAVMRAAHEAGLRSNATLLYNHLETDEQIVDHLRKLRELQVVTGGFKAFVPLPYHGGRSPVPARRPRPTGAEVVRLFATARIYLHNIPHLKALWMYHGLKMAQVLLSFGVDDVGGTYVDEKIVHAAGASTPAGGCETELRALIEQAGFEPVRTRSDYRLAAEGGKR